MSPGESSSTVPIPMDGEQATDLSASSYLSIIAQHASSNFSEQSLDFAAYLFFITLFPRTLIPASILGLGMTLTSVFMSTRIGKMVDTLPRLNFARKAIVVQKMAQLAVYIGFLALFMTVSTAEHSPAVRRGKRGYLYQFRSDTNSKVPVENGTGISGWDGFLLAWIVVCATVGRLATTGITLAVDRDWIVVISGDRPSLLTKLNTSLRRTFLLTKLFSPFLVSLLTTLFSYQTCLLVMMAISTASLAGEQWMIGVVWRGCKGLGDAESARVQARTGERDTRESIRMTRQADSGYRAVPGVDISSSDPQIDESDHPVTSGTWLAAIRETAEDFDEFRRLPVFLSSLSIAALYLTTLSFDGILLSWLKSSQGYSDAFIASMRGICVVTGLLGTFIMPLGEKHLGLVRTGAWSIWSEAACLCAVLIALSFTVTASPEASPVRLSAPVAALFFTSIALSRVGLFAFDLVQVQEIQLALKDHPKSGRFQAAQMGMQSGMEVLKYGIVLVLHKPEQFPWTALISTAAVVIGGLLYTRYVFQVRGHLLHWSKLWGDARHA